MEALLFFVFFCVCSSYAMDRVFFVDQVNHGIYFSKVLPGQRLTDLAYNKTAIEFIRYPGAMTYDPQSDTVIWAQRDPHKIVADTLNGVSNPIDIFVGVKPICMTFNRANGRVYWFGNVSRLLNSIYLNGTDKIRIAKRKTQIGGLCVDSDRGYLYYYDRNRILKMPADGGRETVLFELESNVSALQRNIQDDSLYWVSVAGIIERFDLVANERSTLLNISVYNGHIDHIVVYNGVFYWTDQGYGGIGYIDLNDWRIHGFLQNITVDGKVHVLTGVSDMKVFLGEEGPVDYCSSSPCMQGATCVNERFTYVCNNSGVITTTESPEQASSPCEQTGDLYPCDDLHGSCVNVNGTANCSCEFGYDLASDGVTCEANEVCSNCQNGKCLTTGIFSECICNKGFALGNNSLCDDIDECESDPCDQEYGECVNTAGSFTCSCLEGFVIEGDGVSCQLNCAESPCMNGATCMDNQCYCPYPFVGAFCQNVNCSSEPCQNDGSCLNSTCDCSSGYEGALCEKESSDQKKPQNWELSTAALIIIIVIIILVIFIIIMLIYACYRRSKKNYQPTATDEPDEL